MIGTPSLPPLADAAFAGSAAFAADPMDGALQTQQSASELSNVIQGIATP